MGEKIKVLMVDDEEQFRSTTSKILSRRGYETSMAGRGYETSMAGSGEEAIEILKTAQQDVVVLDIKMPGMDGHEALAQIKKMNPDIQVIMLTGHPDIQVIMLTGHGASDSAKESLQQGAFDYLSKPCDIDLLAAKINDAHAAATHKGVREEKRAKDIMIPIEDYTTIDPESTVREGIERLKRSFEGALSTSRVMETGHRSILVLDGKGDLVGILSIVDLIEALQPSYLSAPKLSMADSLHYSPIFWSGLFTLQATSLANKKIRDIMSAAPKTIDEETNLMEIANLMSSENIRRMVVSRKGKVVGVVREQEIFFELTNIIVPI
ncbi:MAG: response regulator [Deltaproteobacteria bacterium]|nr:response regulator [Deltaproteobacteria bacterium]